MVKISILLALRNLLKYRLYAMTNVLGLCIGIFSFLCIYSYNKHEESYDSFHSRAPHIYRLWDTFTSSQRQSAMMPFKWTQFLESEIPEIANATSIQQVSLVIKDNDQIVNEEHVFAADTGFFKVFGFPVLAGRSEDFFKDPGGIVLAEGVAQKYFGTAAEAMGETLKVGFTGAFRVMKVVGVVACPSNSHIQFDFLVPFQPVIANSFNPPAYESFTTHFVYTYVHIPGNFNPQELTLKFKNFLHRHGDEALKSRFTTSFQPLSEIYLDSTQEFDFTPRGSRTNVEILWIVAWLVLLIATVNFVNLTTAQSMKKVREVGLQKVFGSNRSQLVGRFLAESILLCLMACVLAFVLMGAMLPLINEISGINFLLCEVVRVKLVLVGMSISLIVGIIGGVYPAFLVSSINSYQALRTNDHPKSIGFLTRKVLIVLQFVISMLLIVSTLVISEQLQFMKSKDLGIASEQVLLIKDRAAVANNKEKILLLRNALKSDEIRSVTTTSTYPGVQSWSVGFIPAGHEEAVSYPCIFTDHEFALTYDIPIVQGRDFDVSMASDSLGFLINETARNQFGAFDSTWLQQPIGKKIKSTYLQMDGPVIGVMKDFHFMSPHEAIKPLIVMVYPRLKSATQIRIQSNDLGATLQRIESVWTRLNPTVPFEYQFIDDVFNEAFENDQKLSALFKVFSFICILLAMVGLFGLTSFMTREKMKMSSIKKVLGAHIYQIILDLLRPVLWLMGLSIAIALPVSYFLMERWLSDFPYRIALTPDIMALSVGLIAIITLLTISYHSLKLATSNPVSNLRE